MALKFPYKYELVAEIESMQGIVTQVSETTSFATVADLFPTQLKVSVGYNAGFYSYTQRSGHMRTESPIICIHNAENGYGS